MERKMAVGPSCFVRRETRELNERRQGLAVGAGGGFGVAPSFFPCHTARRCTRLLIREEELRDRECTDDWLLLAECQGLNGTAKAERNSIFDRLSSVHASGHR